MAPARQLTSQACIKGKGRLVHRDARLPPSLAGDCLPMKMGGLTSRYEATPEHHRSSNRPTANPVPADRRRPASHDRHRAASGRAMSIGKRRPPSFMATGAPARPTSSASPLPSPAMPLSGSSCRCASSPRWWGSTTWSSAAIIPMAAAFTPASATARRSFPSSAHSSLSRITSSPRRFRRSRLSNISGGHSHLPDPECWATGGARPFHRLPQLLRAETYRRPGIPGFRSHGHRRRAAGGCSVIPHLREAVH